MRKTARKKPTPLWLIGLGVWAVAFVAFTGFWFYECSRKGLEGQMEWAAWAVGALGPAILVVMIVQRIRAEPTPEERAAFWALLAAEPGTIGAVVVKKKGVPEVIATVRSVEEYWMLASKGKLPADHQFFMEAPEENPKQEP